MENEWISYLLRSSLCLALLYLPYKGLLSRQPFHALNRAILLGICIASLLVPLLRLKGGVESDWSLLLSRWQLLPAAVPSPSVPAAAPLYTPRISPGWLVTGIYLTGVFLFLIRFLYSHFRIVSQLRRCHKRRLKNGAVLALHRDDIPSFGWWNYLVIPEKEFREEGGVIVAHELSHRARHHSADLLFTGLFSVFLWFNPFAWWLRRELRTVHEYEADQGVLQVGTDMKSYQLLLIRKAVGTTRFSQAVNLFNHSKIKKRIAMMLSEKSKPRERVKYLLLLPLFALAAWACSRQDVESQNISGPETVQVAKTPSEIFFSGSPEERQMYREKIMENHPLFLLNGEEVSEETIKELDTKLIESVTMLKDKSAATFYGEKGAHGVVVVKTTGASGK